MASLHLRGKRSPLRWGWLACLVLPGALWAQAAGAAAPVDWKRANEAVAEFPRGHADVLKWEQAQPASAAMPAQPANTLPLPTPAHAARLAWQTHRDLASVQARAGAEVTESIAQGQWAALDPRLLRRVHGADELLAVAAQARKAWVQAVAGQQLQQPLQTRADAADAALELGQRMVAVGNWSALQLAPVQLAKAAAHREWARARYAAAQAQHDLLKLLPPTVQASGVGLQLALPATLPDLPASPMSAVEVKTRLQALHSQMPPANAWVHANTARLALVAYEASWAVAQGYRSDELPTRQLITDETLLRYNGMLKSVWDLLAETGNQAQAQVDAVQAQRDFWLAHTDLTWALQGGLPDALVNLGGGGGAASATAAGH